MAKKKSESQPDESKEASSASRKSKTVLLKKKVSPSRSAPRSGRKTSPTSVPLRQEGPLADPPDLQARIADRAHELYMHRGGHHGQDWEDWFEAERQVLQEGC